MLGRFLGFDVTYGGYEPRGSVRFEGHWRSRRRARIVLEVRSEQTQDADVDELSRTLAVLAATSADNGDERWVGLCVTTPFYASRRRLESMLAQRDLRDVRCVTIESLLWLAEMAASDRLEHDDVVRLLTSGPDSDFMIDLMRRLTDSANGTVASTRSSAPAVHDEAQHAPAVAPSPGVADSERQTTSAPDDDGYWMANLTSDENATPEQVLDSVIRRRQVLGITAGPLPLPARSGDRVCFFINGAGVVGHARLDTVISDASAIIRGARRFAAVFRLRDVTIYDVPIVVTADSVAQRIADRVPFNAAGAYLAPISGVDYDALTTDQHAPRAQAL
jgi:hypothetical protein